MTDCIKKANQILAVMDGMKCDLEYAEHCKNVGIESWSCGDAKAKAKYIIDKMNELYSELKKLEGEN
ncbi:MAG: hypothetical protein IKE69_11655 [Thermoguttaceae bacterium]|nr:hypothetical protein [Thermoguttaceae bacterium]